MKKTLLTFFFIGILLNIASSQRGLCDYPTAQSSMDNLLLQYCKQGDSIKIKELLDNGARVNFLTSEGYFPLRYAIESYDMASVKLIYYSGAQTMYCYYDRSRGYDVKKYYPTVNLTKVLGLFEKQSESVFQKKLEYLKSIIEFLYPKRYRILETFEESELFYLLNKIKGEKALELYDFFVSKGMETKLEHIFEPRYFNGLISVEDTLYFNGLIKRGANVNHTYNIVVSDNRSQTYYHDSPLMLAIKKQNLFSITWVIENKGDINYVNEKSTNGICSPLMEAIKSGNLEIVKILVEKSANVNCNCNTGSNSKQTPLGLAMALNADKIIDLLVEVGAK